MAVNAARQVAYQAVLEQNRVSIEKYYTAYPGIRAYDQQLRDDAKKQRERQAAIVEVVTAKPIETPALYGCTRAIELISGACRTADAFAEQWRAELDRLEQARREGQRIDPESIDTVKRRLARQQAVGGAIGKCIAFLNQRAAELRQEQIA